MTIKKDKRLSRLNDPVIPAKHQQAAIAELRRRGILAHFYNQAAPLENSLIGLVTSIYEFFHSNGYNILREDWDKNTIPEHLQNFSGWVYSFYGEEDFPIYVGETGRKFITRFSEHKKKQSWWSSWNAVKVLPCPSKPIRKIFESLIGVAGGYNANQIQPVVGDNIFDDVILSLLILRSENNQLPIFPNETISNDLDLVSCSLEHLGISTMKP